MVNLTEYHDWLIELGRSGKTIMAYLGDLYQFGAWFAAHNGDDLEPRKLTAIDWRDYRQFLLAEKFSSSTINRKLAAIQSYATWCIKAQGLEYNPLDGARGIRKVRQAPHWLDRREQGAILRELERGRLAAKTDNARLLALRNQVIVLVMLNTGLRVSELCALVWGDVVINDRSGLVIVRDGKGSKSREVPLNLTARNALVSWNKKENLGFVQDQVFSITPRSIQIALAEIGHRAHVDLNPHKLRHTFAKSLVDAGVSLDRVAQLLGHDRLETTILYTTPSSKDLERDVERLD